MPMMPRHVQATFPKHHWRITEFQAICSRFSPLGGVSRVYVDNVRLWNDCPKCWMVYVVYRCFQPRVCLKSFHLDTDMAILALTPSLVPRSIRYHHSAHVLPASWLCNLWKFAGVLYNSNELHLSYHFLLPHTSFSNMWLHYDGACWIVICCNKLRTIQYMIVSTLQVLCTKT